MKTVITLTPDDVESLRRASSIVCFADSEGRAKVRAILEKNDPADYSKAEARIFSTTDDVVPRQRTREFRCDGYAKSTVGLMGYENPLGKARLIGTAFIMSARFSPAWRTVSRLAKPGNGLEFQFLADHGTTKSLHEAGFHSDELYARIWTPDEKHGYLLTYEFLLDVQTTPHNSARMVRAEGDARQATATLNIDDFWSAA